MSRYGDGSKKEMILDGILWASGEYEDDEEGRKQFAADLVQVCADMVADLLVVDRW